MNDQESYREIEDLLRADKPRVTPPPGLEADILRLIEESEKLKKRRFLPWLLVPAAAAAGIIMLRPIQTPAAGTKTIPVVQPQVEVVDVETPRIGVPRVEEAIGEVVVEERKLSAFFENPLAREARALKRDARRAGHFLINALPSLNVEAE